MFGLSNYLHCIDRPCLDLTPEVRDEAVESGVRCLQSYEALAHYNLQKRRCNYKFRPKWHALCHLIFDMRSSLENPRKYKTMLEEDALGKLTKLAEKCPASNATVRLLQRYQIFLAMHFHELAH